MGPGHCILVACFISQYYTEYRWHSRNKVCKCVRISRYLTSILICSQLPTLVIFLVSKRFMEPLGILVAWLGCKRVMRLRVKRHLQQFVVLLCIKIAFLLQYFQRTETAVSAPFVILNYSRTVQVVPTCTLQTVGNLIYFLTYFFI